MNKHIGTVKWFSETKGFGFLVGDDHEAFVHFTAIQGDGFRFLNAGEKVEYELVKEERGLRAVNVRVIY